MNDTRLGPNQRRALQLLAASPDGMSRAELQTALGIADLRSMQSMLKRLQERQLLHVGGWRYESAGASCPACRVFMHGPGDDVPRPAALGRSICRQRYRERVGRDLYNRVSEARKRGATQLIIDGLTVWRRGEFLLRQNGNI